MTLHEDMSVYLQRLHDSQRIELKQPLRDKLAGDIAKFLSSGKTIEQVDPGERRLDPKLMNW